MHRSLTQGGFSVIAIDLRGHGASEGNWRSFSPREFNAVVLDVKAAKDYLISRGVKPGRMGIVGASIGANIALRYAAEDGEIKTVVLLSPGLNYRGVAIEEAAKHTPRRSSFTLWQRERRCSRGFATLGMAHGHTYAKRLP